MQWSELNHEQQVALAGWYLITLAVPEHVRPTDDMPLDYSRAIAELSATAGHYAPRRFIRQRLGPGIPLNRQRKVRVRKQRHQLATNVGEPAV
ncbi:hypothetical protein FHT44_004913 [Mycolicibacterium sp. BK634]|nr:hypothetical protein [Mycolicibacterium sp. BK634]